MDLELLFKEFAISLSSRDTILTEDSVRYIFYSCMLRQDDVLGHYIMEVPYKSILDGDIQFLTLDQDNGLITTPSGKLFQELDMLYDDSTDTRICVEIKFHRTGNLESTYAHTDAAGRIINDIRRLQLIHSTQRDYFCRLFVYVTDDNMHKYLSNKQNKDSDYRKRLSNLYQLPVGKTLSFECDESDPNTFLKSASFSFFKPRNDSITVKKVFEQEFLKSSCPSLNNGECHIAIFAVDPSSNH